MPDTKKPTFKDHFSGHAASYAASRPRYPAALFSELAGLCASHERAWDCATGNGQAARSLSAHFEQVIATDASAEQIESAEPHARIEYRVVPAEDPGLDAASVDLITVAQALHWFDVERFFAAAENVLRPGGILAYWCYGFCAVDEGCEDVIRSLYEFVGDYWPPERVIVENGYRDIEPPLPTVEMAEHHMQVEWSADQMIDYMQTWSACQRYRRTTGENPLDGFAPTLKDRWGPGSRVVRWPLKLTIGRAPGPAGG